MSLQDVTEHIIDQHYRGKITAEEANIQMVEAARYKLIKAPLRKEVRAALNKAVKEGRLGHFKKNGLQPEAYYHHRFKYLAIKARREALRAAIDSMGGNFYIE